MAKRKRKSGSGSFNLTHARPREDGVGRAVLHNMDATTHARPREDGAVCRRRASS